MTVRRSSGGTRVSGWLIPPPREPVKSADEFRREREEKVRHPLFYEPGDVRAVPAHPRRAEAHVRR